MKKQLALCGVLGLAISALAQVYTTYHWHQQQPIYWPETSQWNSNTYQKAYESIQLRNGGAAHPQNDVEQIFGIDDRRAAYQWRMRDAIGAMSGGDSGAQSSYGGCLIENVASQGEHGFNGYSSGWMNPIRTARNWTTSDGYPRLDMVLFPYHHCLAPLVDEDALRMELRIQKEIYDQAWGAYPGVSQGFFPPELAFSERIIKVLVEEGVEWTFVPNNHISRACSNFPLIMGTGGENCDPPNLADQINPASSEWFSLTIDRGCTPTNAVPMAYTPAKAEYVDPETGAVSRITVVPVAMAMSWEDGYQTYGIQHVSQIAHASNPSQPILVALAHDGDNAFGGGYSYYMESVPSFTSQAVGAGYTPTVVQQYLHDHPVSASNVIHVEDGAWVNADGDFGSPDFINWNWPLVYGSSFNIPGGWAEDERNWAVITAAQNRVSTAEQIAGGVDPASVQDPVTQGATDAELAWHFFLPALTSGYMYYGTSLDMEVKPTIACNNAVAYADGVIGNGSQDQTPPTVWIPQQLPHNPGGIGFGSLYGYQQTMQPRDFWIWTFVHDVSGVDSVLFKYRLDNDGVNPLANHDNETYAGGSGVEAWRSQSMTQRSFPLDNFFNDPNIDFFELPLYIADEYYTHVTDSDITDEGDVLVDYYVEAWSNGLVKRTPIQHTYVGDGSGGSGGSDDVVRWWPAELEGGDTVHILYDLSEGALPGDTDPVYIHLGHSGWSQIVSPDPSMTWNADSSAWEYAYTVPQSATSVDFVFNNGSGTWDNNNDADWHISVTPTANGGAWEIDGELDANAELLGTVGERSLWGAWNGSELYLAATPAPTSGTDHFLMISDGSSVTQSAPWAKGGTTTRWAAFVGQEESNGWCGWFDLEASTSASVAYGSVLEASITLESELGEIPETVRVALAAYASADGGSLQAQVPAGNGDANLDYVEWYPLHLHSGSGVPLAVEDLSITLISGLGIQLDWSAIEEDTSGEPLQDVMYRVQVSSDPYAETWQSLALTTATSWQHPGVQVQPDLYYRVIALTSATLTAAESRYNR